MRPPFALDGRTALVTGASRGIGRGAALALAGAGAAVALTARSQDELEAVALECLEAGAPQALTLPADVTDEAQLDLGVLERAVAATGRLDVLVNVAGGSRFNAPVAQTRTAGWEAVVALNLRAVFVACRQALAHLPDGGSIVNVASIAGLVSSPGLAAYGAAKAGVIALTRTLAVEAAPAGVRVNCLVPGWVRTELTRFLWSDPARSDELTRQVPMRRWGEVEELAGPLLLLASPAGSYLTGATLVVDGGLTA